MIRLGVLLLASHFFATSLWLAPTCAQELPQSSSFRKDFAELVRRGKIQEATDLLNETIESYPDARELRSARQQLVRRLLASRKYAKAFDHAKVHFTECRLRVDDPNGAGTFAAAALLLSQTIARGTRSTEAEKYLREAIILLDAKKPEVPGEFLHEIATVTTAYALVIQAADDQATSLAMLEMIVERLNEFNAKTFSESERDDELDLQVAKSLAGANKTKYIKSKTARLSAAKAQSWVMGIIWSKFQEARTEQIKKQMTEFAENALKVYPNHFQHDFVNLHHSITQQLIHDDPANKNRYTDAFRQKTSSFAGTPAGEYATRLAHMMESK